MKKLVLSIILSVSLLGSVFAENIFAHRFFEVRVDVPIAVSNNLMGLTDIFQKEVTINLPELADSVKLDGGARIRAEAYPTLGINLDIPRGLILGVNIGADADVSLGLSDDIFQFIGHGNAGMGQKFKQKTTNTYVDLFAHVDVTGGWNGKKNRLAVTGSAFFPLAHLDAGDTYVALYNNDEEGEFKAEANVDAKLYASADYSNMDDIQKLIDQSKKGMGFDLSADYQRDLFRFLTVGATARIPIVPGRLGMVSKVHYNYPFTLNIDDLLNEKDGDSGNNSGNTSEPEEDKELEFTSLSTPYEIHRPLKLGVSANFHPFGTLLSTSGYLGIGVRHPFAKDVNETSFYLDYSVAGKLSLWNILNFEMSHSYTDQMFKNEFAIGLNIRLVEVDAGVSFQSTSFAKSFTGAGIGAYVTACVGF